MYVLQVMKPLQDGEAESSAIFKGVLAACSAKPLIVLRVHGWCRTVLPHWYENALVSGIIVGCEMKRDVGEDSRLVCG